MNCRVLFVSSLFFILSACGGGGSGDSGSNVVSPAPSVALTTINGAQVASTAGTADSIATNAASGFGTLSLSQPTQNAVSLTDLTRQIFNLGQGQTFHSLAVTTCSNGGTMSAPDDPNATSGTLVFTNCDLNGTGVVLNGTVSFSGTSNSNSFSLNITYSNFTVTVSGTTSTFNATMSISDSVSGTVDTLVVSMPTFELTVASNYVSMYNYHFMATSDSSTSTYTLSWDYTFESSLINGVVYVATEQDIQGYDYNPYPDTGSVVITGVNNSHVRVSTNGAGQATDMVLIEFDEDGDGVYESSDNTLTWADFDLLKAVL